MAGNLMQYSGLITKTRAMSGRLLSEEQMCQMTELATVNEAVQYLKGIKGYDVLYQEREGIWHRGQVEAVIENSLYQDFEKLYRFADAKQRQAFEYVLFRYEVDLLKQCLKNLYQKDKDRQEILVDDFFERHARFSVENIKKASGVQEFAQALTGTPYENVFMQMHNSAGDNYATMALWLDIHYYTRVYQDIRRMKASALKKILLEIYGTQIDWLNIMWIYRSKRFYSQTRAELKAATIPFTYRLKREELKGLIEAANLNELNKILTETGYFKGKDAYVQMEDEISYRKIIRTMYQRVSRKYPVSIAPVMKYIYEKEQEIRRLTTIIEGIRYQIPAGEIKDLILITK